ncbi:MAG: right-handed parallel beta-helix repeat-containing protein, partial [Planctomycetaceae bacterium]
MQGGILSKWFVVIVCACAAAAIGAPATVIYVDAGANGTQTGSSWADACNHLQDALALAATAEKPVEIRVAQGVYKPDQGTGITPGDRAATFKLLNGVSIKGGYAGVAASDPNTRDIKLYETLLSGDVAGDDGPKDSARHNNSLRVITGSGTDKTAVLDGLTVTAGFSAFDPAGASGDRGAGLMVNAGSPTVLNCRFIGNHASGPGGAVTARNGSNPILTGCEFLNNQGAGFYCRENSNPVLTNCRFEGNIFRDMESQNSSPVITGCQFLNTGVNAIQAVDCNFVLMDCMFTGGDGRMPTQGIHFMSGRATLTGCTFTGFTDGAMEAPDDLTLVRCTFRDNSGFLAGAVRGSFNRHMTALECVFAGNHGSIAGAIWNGDTELHDCEFTGNSGSGVGAVEAGPEAFIATGCVFSGNSANTYGVGAISGHAEIFKLSNCTFVGNRGRYTSLDGRFSGMLPIQITQCIIRDGPEPFESRPPAGMPMRIDATFSNIQGGYPGEGNIDVDPCFVDPGYWASPDDLT